MCKKSARGRHQRSQSCEKLAVKWFKVQDGKTHPEQCAFTVVNISVADHNRIHEKFEKFTLASLLLLQICDNFLKCFKIPFLTDHDCNFFVILEGSYCDSFALI